MTMGDDDPRGVANLDPRGMIGRIYEEYHLILLDTNIQTVGIVVIEKKIFKRFSNYKPMADNDAPGAWPIWTPGSRLAAIIKGRQKGSARKIQESRWVTVICCVAVKVLQSLCCPFQNATLNKASLSLSYY